MPKLNKQKTEKAYLSVFNFMHKGTFNLVDGVASHKNMKNSGSDVGNFIYFIIRICINRLMYDGYCNHVIGNILKDAYKDEIKRKIEQDKEDIKNFKLN
mgnify:CR=1 FL=1